MLQGMAGLPQQGILHILALAQLHKIGLFTNNSKFLEPFQKSRQSIFNYLLISREELLLELVAGLASGLHHLHQAGIYHGAVCARNVFMVGETGNKININFPGIPK